MKKYFKNPITSVSLFLFLFLAKPLSSSQVKFNVKNHPLSHLLVPKENCRALLYADKEELTLFRYAILYAEKVLQAQRTLRRFQPFQNIEEAIQKMPVQSQRFYDVEAIKGDGIGHLHLFSAKRGNPPEKLFIKVPNVSQAESSRFLLGTRTPVDVLNEINWARFLSEMALGPRFFGVYQEAEGRIALVYEYFEGDHVSRFGNYKFSTPQAKENALSALREMREIFSFLAVNVHDLQFRVDSRGNVKIIDAEFFDIADPEAYSKFFSRENLEVFFRASNKTGYQTSYDSSSNQVWFDTRKVFDFYINALEKSN